MKHLVILSRTRPKIQNCTVRDFQEQLESYLTLHCRKLKGKQKVACSTPEGFQLEYDSFYEDLKRAYYVYPGNDEVEALIRQKFKVLEDNDYDF